MFIKNQQGVGLLEVLIALLLLAVAVLGFSAMQLRAIQATDETLTRSDAMVIIRNISEDLRLLATAKQKKAYKDAMASTTPPTFKCVGGTGGQACTAEQRVQYNAHQAKELAKLSHIKVAAVDCGVQKNNNLNKLCIIASWNETEADMKGEANSCAKSDGTYMAGSSCIVMETY